MKNDLAPGFYDDEVLDGKSRDISVTERYKILVDTRKFEIDNFIKRTTFFWTASLAGLAVHFGSSIDLKSKMLLSIMATTFSLYFSIGARGAKYWQENWERKVEKFERKIGFSLFSTRSDVEKKWWPFCPIRFSPSAITMIISDTLTISWLGITILNLLEASTKNVISFERYRSGGTFDAFSTMYFCTIIFSGIYLAVFGSYTIWQNIRTTPIVEALKDGAPDEIILNEGEEIVKPDEIPLDPNGDEISLELI